MHREVCCQRTVIRQGTPAGWLLYGGRRAIQWKSFDVLILQKAETSKNRYNKIATQHSEARQE